MRCLAAAVWFAFLASVVASAQTLRIFHIDVEQADATLFVAPSGKTLLVDSGQNGSGDEIKAVMDNAGVTKIDFLVTTHYHSDHFGGIDDLTGAPPGFGVTVSKAFDRGDKDAFTQTEKDKPTMKGYLTAVGNSAEKLSPGDTIDLDQNMTVKCVAAGRKVIGDTSSSSSKSHENDSSVSLLIEWGEFDYFIGGDIESATEKKIAAQDLALDVDVYQANHHGSDTSSEDSFIKDLTPSVVIISNGNHAGHKHPQQDTLDALAALTPAPTVFQTNKYFHGGSGGNVGDEFIADLGASGEDGTILLEVNAAKTQYTVSYRGKVKTFPVKGAGPSGTVVIASLLPDPDGSDKQNEVVTLRNDSASTVSLSGWTLRDASNNFVNLTIQGSIAPMETLDIVRKGSRLSLNNNGDTIRLLDDNGATVDEVTYGPVAEDEVVVGH